MMTSTSALTRSYSCHGKIQEKCCSSKKSSVLLNNLINAQNLIMSEDLMVEQQPRIIILQGRKIVRKKKRQCVKCHDGNHDCNNRLSPDRIHKELLSLITSSRETDSSEGKFQIYLNAGSNYGVTNLSQVEMAFHKDGTSIARSSKPPPTPPSRRTRTWETETETAHVESSDERGLSHQLSSASTHSLPSRIDQISDGEDDFEEDEDSSSALDPYELDSTPTNTSPEVILGTGRKYSSCDKSQYYYNTGPSSTTGQNSTRRGNKLKRRKAYYNRQRKDIAGRSKSLTSIDTIGPTMPNGGTSASDLGGLDCGGRLSVPMRPERSDHSTPSSPGYHRRRKLSTASKVSSSEFFTVNFECLDDLRDRGYEEFVPATRGTCLREAISAVCERRGVDVDSINVYLEQSRTPLPLLTTETAWLGGRHIRIRAKDDSKSPVRGGGGRISVTAPPSRKPSATNNSYRAKSKNLFSPSISTSDDLQCPSTTSTTSTAGPNNSNMLSQSLSVGGLQSNTPSLAAIHSNSCGSPNNFNNLSARDISGLGGNSTENSLKVTKSSKPVNRWSGLWGSSSKDTKMDLLVTHLDTYSRLGIPKLHHLVAFEAEDEVEEALYSLEEDWTEIVRNAHMLSEKARSQQQALWELVETEVAYIRTLKVIQDLFLNCLCNLQNNMVLTEIDTERLFCNIPEIYAANRVFWHDYIMPMLTVSRKCGEPLDPILMKEGFIKFEEIFNPYSRYCSEQTNCQEYCKEQDRNSEVFKAYLAWCESQNDSTRLRLIDILVRPMQRLTKYALLLKAVLKKTEDTEQQDTLKAMAKKVEAFVSHVNSHLRQRQENERLKTIIARIDSYEPVETKDEDLEKLVQAHCRLDLTAPMPGCATSHQRNLLFEGDLKLKEGTASKLDVHAFLFSDMLLLCKVLTKKSHSSNPEARMKIIRQPFAVDRLLVSEINKDNQSSSAGGLALVYLNEYHVVSTAFTLHSPEAKILKVWKEQIAKAKELYQEAKNSPSAASSTMMSSNVSRFYYTSSNASVVRGQFSTSNDLDEDGSNAFLTADRDSTTSTTTGGLGGGGGSCHRRGSSYRGSRISSVAHSHSGSVDLMEAAGFKRDVSLELSHANTLDQNRASSLSSEEGGNNLNQPPPPTSSLESSSSTTTTGQQVRNQCSYPSSPRAERRGPLIKSITPNTLTVQIPYGPVQSLPNLVPTSSSSPNSSAPPSTPGGGDPPLATPPPPSTEHSSSHHQHHHHAPRLSSPIPSRGISYPPLSPKSSLRRSVAIQQSNSVPNPSTTSTATGGNVISRSTPTNSSLKNNNRNNNNRPSPTTTTTITDGITIPVITTGTGPPDAAEEFEDESEENSSKEYDHDKPSPAARKGRIERGADARRYHTAGAIEDIKKQDGKDTSIQKRLSWNYGQHIPNQELTLQQQQRLPGGPQGRIHSGGSKCLSSESMHSSSGVSSTGSLHLSIGSEWEDSTASTGTVVTATHIYRNLQSSKEDGVDPEPDSDPSKLQNKTNLSTTSSSSINKSGPVPPPIPPRTNQSHHVTTTYITQDEVTISSSSTTVSASSSAGGGATGSTSGGGTGATTLAGPESPNSTGGSIQIAVVSNDPKKKNEILKLRDMLLTDNSVESSNV